jgi:hypothetical protein
MTAASRYASKQRSRARSNALVSAGIEGQVGQVLDDLIDACSNMRDAWPAVGEVFADRQRKVFATGGTGVGKWAPLEGSTIIRKRLLGQPMTTLVATGSLLQAVTSSIPTAYGDRFAVYGVTKGSAVIDYAIHHSRGHGNPQRNPVPRMTPTEMRRVVEKIRDHFRPDYNRKAV